MSGVDDLCTYSTCNRCRLNAVFGIWIRSSDGTKNRPPSMAVGWFNWGNSPVDWAGVATRLQEIDHVPKLARWIRGQLKTLEFSGNFHEKFQKSSRFFLAGFIASRKMHRSIATGYENGHQNITLS
jgi:hypothetical protein